MNDVGPSPAGDDDRAEANNDDGDASEQAAHVRQPFVVGVAALSTIVESVIALSTIVEPVVALSTIVESVIAFSTVVCDPPPPLPAGPGLAAEPHAASAMVAASANVAMRVRVIWG